MIIQDTLGKFILKVDKQRRIVYETNTGVWTKEDFERFTDAYYKKVVPYLGKGSWSKYNDLRKYTPSTAVTSEMIGEFVKKTAESGYKCAAALVDSATLRMQIGRNTKDVSWELCYFDDEKKADEWLKSKGF